MAANICEKRDNYEIARQRAQELFAEYDQKGIIRRFKLDSDENSIFLRFAGNPYRIDRKTGQAFVLEGGGKEVPAVFSDSMTIYDVLCTAKENASLSGKFCTVNSLTSVHAGSQPSADNYYKKVAEGFDGHLDALKNACLAMGGVPESEIPVKGDLVMRLPVFDFMPVILQFYKSDDEFPASVNLMWDENIIDFMKYETVWYAAGFIYDKLLAYINGEAPKSR